MIGSENKTPRHLRQRLWLVASALGTLFTLSLVAWALTRFGTAGLWHVNHLVRLPIVALALLGLAIPILTILNVRRKIQWTKKGFRFPARHVRILACIGIVLPLGLFGYLNNAYLTPAGDKPPQLLLCEGRGSGGIPDLAVAFWTGAPTQNTLSWGTGTDLFTVQEYGRTREHLFRLPDLAPATAYWYRINEGPTYRFTSPPVEGQPLRFAVTSDAHFGNAAGRPDITAQILQQVSDPEHGLNSFFYLGDLTEQGYNEGSWQAALDTFTATTATLPTRIVPGNHDTLFAGLGLYERYTAPRGLDDWRDSSRSRLWSRIDLGRVHILLLDIEWSLESFTGEQRDWLENQLAGIPRQDWTIVMNHSVYYASGIDEYGWGWYDNPETIATLTPIFEKYQVDMVFTGHNHHMEMLEQSGIPYFVCGTMGGFPEPFRTHVSPQSKWYQTDVYGLAEVAIEDNTATVTFRDPDYGVIKTFTVANQTGLSSGS
jgi:hypothetical protein